VHGAPIQILDLPGIIEGANDGRGRGRQGAYKDDDQFMYLHYVLYDILAVIAGVVTYLDLIGPISHS